MGGISLVSFTHDIFLSYAHIDDLSPGGGDGWAKSLHDRLSIRLHQLLGEDAKIWWDDRKQENQYLVDTIGDKISESILLTAILSPRYANSAWCRGELQEFCSRADATGGINLKGMSRLFCAVKTPVTDDRIPQALRFLKRYEFYEIDASNKVREFRPEPGAHRDQRYWDKFEDLAQALKLAIETLRPKAANLNEPKELPLGKKVYLAATSADMQRVRDTVMRELQEQGYYVLPRDPLPLNVPNFQETVADHLSRCSLSIHIIGAGYGVIPDGEEEKSIVRLQLELAAKRAKAEPSFAPLAWMPIGLETGIERQRLFIEEVQSKLGAELLQDTVENLKSRILEKLRPKPSRRSGESRGLKRVYLICDNRDLDEVAPIDDFLYNQGFEVIPTINDGNKEDLAQYHRENLINCDGALIYYGHANQLWLRLKISDLLKAPGWGRTKPMLSKIYVTGPCTVEKQRFRTREAEVIRHFDTFTPDVLRSFINDIKRSNGGRQ